jgi:hypothetical protein
LLSGGHMNYIPKTFASIDLIDQKLDLLREKIQSIQNDETLNREKDIDDVVHESEDIISELEGLEQLIQDKIIEAKALEIDSLSLS